MHSPIFIPSRGRADITGAAAMLDKIGCPDYRIIVEQDEKAAYTNRWGSERVLVLPVEFQQAYDPLDGHGQKYSLGSGPSRNYAWHLAKEMGTPWHWLIDDNVTQVYRYGMDGVTVVSRGPEWFRDLEKYITQWVNVGMGGPQAESFVAHRHQNTRRAVKNTRIYSFNLIRTDMPFRWRGRWNEDTILSLDMLTRGWATILCYHYLMKKPESRRVKGGNTDELYKHGTGPKSRLLAAAYPKYVDVRYRFGRIHHFVNYKKHFGDIPLIKHPAR